MSCFSSADSGFERSTPKRSAPIAGVVGRTTRPEQKCGGASIGAVGLAAELAAVMGVSFPEVLGALAASLF